MLTRRSFLEGAALLAGAGTASPAGAAPVLTEDGLYTQPWFLESFLILSEDVEAATAKGKRFAVMWELRGCPACKETHLVNFADPAIEEFVRGRFEILQLNILGSREVTDFDGERLAEKELARKYGVRGTPAFQFYAESTAGLAAKPPREREAYRARGYLKPADFRGLFAYVADKAYERGTFPDYLKAQG
jgi:thioredoxin-related protein